MNKKHKQQLKKGVYYIFITIITLIFIVPFIFVLYTSVRDSTDILRDGFVAPIKKLCLGNYWDAFRNGTITEGIINSLKITIPSLFLSIALASIAAYALARVTFKGSKIIFLFILITMYIPAAVKLIPIYKFYSNLHLTNSIGGLILLQCTGSIPFCIFVLRNFFLTVPKELQEAAIIDGCNYFTIYHKIYLPLSKPSIAVLLILQFTAIWNSFIWELLLMRDRTPIMVAVMSLQSQYGIEWSLQCAGAIIASIPTLIVFLCFQRYFISGLTAGAIKG